VEPSEVESLATAPAISHTFSFSHDSIKMATPPPAKKQKVAKVKAPVVFKQAGLGSPDTCLVVFEQEFHVHSTILKLYSAFFRKFLDSPDKAHATSTKNFKYFWVTEVENDGD
jgi:hypothetical protein